MRRTRKRRNGIPFIEERRVTERKFEQLFSYTTLCILWTGKDEPLSSFVHFSSHTWPEKRKWREKKKGRESWRGEEDASLRFLMVRKTVFTKVEKVQKVPWEKNGQKLDSFAQWFFSSIFFCNTSQTSSKETEMFFSKEWGNVRGNSDTTQLHQVQSWNQCYFSHQMLFEWKRILDALICIFSSWRFSHSYFFMSLRFSKEGENCSRENGRVIYNIIYDPTWHHFINQSHPKHTHLIKAHFVTVIITSQF